MAKKLVLLALSLTFVLFVLFSCTQPAPKVSKDDIVIKFSLKAPEVVDSKTNQSLQAAYYEALKVGKFVVTFSQKIGGSDVVRFTKDVTSFDRSGLTYSFEVRFPRSEAFELGKYNIEIKAYPENVGIYKEHTGNPIMSATLTHTFTEGGQVNLPQQTLKLEKGNLIVNFQLESDLTSKGYEILTLTRDGTTTGVSTETNFATIVSAQATDAGVRTFVIGGTIQSGIDLIKLEQYGNLKITAMVYPAATNIVNVRFGNNGTYKLDIFFDEPEDENISGLASAPVIFRDSVLVAATHSGLKLHYATYTTAEFGTVNSTPATTGSIDRVFTPIVCDNTSHGKKLFVAYVADDNTYLFTSTDTTFYSTVTSTTIFSDRVFLQDMAYYGDDYLIVTYQDVSTGKYLVGTLHATELSIKYYKDIEGTPITAPIVAGNRVLIGVELSGPQYQIWDLSWNFSEAKTTKFSDKFGEFAIEGNYVYFILDDDKVVRKTVNSTDWTQVATITGATVTTAPVIKDGKLYVGGNIGSKSGIFEVNLSTGATKTVAEVSGNDVIKYAPIVDSDGYIYFATSGSDNNFVYLVDPNDPYTILRYKLGSKKLIYDLSLSKGAFFVPTENTLNLFSNNFWIKNKSVADTWSKFRGDLKNSAKK